MSRLLADTVRLAAPAPQAPAMSVEQRLAIVRKLAGSVKLPADFDYREAVAEELAKKYGL